MERLGGEHEGRTGSIRQVVLASFIGTALLASYGYTAVATYMAIMALITVVSVILASETYRENISEPRAEERRLVTE